jgi:hypothetical protein
VIRGLGHWEGEVSDVRDTTHHVLRSSGADNAWLLNIRIRYECGKAKRRGFVDPCLLIAL